MRNPLVVAGALIIVALLFFAAERHRGIDAYFHIRPVLGPAGIKR